MTSVPQAVTQHPVRRYSNAAVTLHWLTAALVIVQVVIGFTFESMAQGPARGELFTWHKTIGATILVLALIRLAYRLMNPPPPFPEDLPHWRRVAAVWNHRAFYFLLIVLPLTGLIAVSGAGMGATTPLVGGIPLPIVPGIDKATGEISGEVHVVLVLTTILLLLLHVGAALYQQYFEHDRAAGRMPPFKAPSGEEAVVGQGSAALQ